MTVWTYDIWDGDKGIIFAPTEEDAERIFKENYDNEIVDGDCGPGKCMISKLQEYYGGEDIMFLWN